MHFGPGSGSGRCVRQFFRRSIALESFLSNVIAHWISQNPAICRSQIRRVCGGLHRSKSSFHTSFATARHAVRTDSTTRVASNLSSTSALNRLGTPPCFGPLRSNPLPPVTNVSIKPASGTGNRIRPCCAITDFMATAESQDNRKEPAQKSRVLRA